MKQGSDLWPKSGILAPSRSRLRGGGGAGVSVGRDLADGPDSGEPIAVSDYERILDVLDACAGARSLTALRETLLESLASRFGHRHAAVFISATRGCVFQDAGALTLGRTSRTLPAYLER